VTDWPLRDEQRARHLGLRRGKTPDKTVKAVMSGEWRDTPQEAEARDAHRLLTAAADALNALEAAGYPVKLAHGTVLTPVGYVLPAFTDPGARYAARTMAFTEFPVTPDTGDD
jgi:hypothetical protein